MCHQAVNANIFETPQRIAEFRDVFGAHPEPTHAGVDLDVSINSCLRVCCGAIQRFNRVYSVDDGREIVLNAESLLTLPNSGHAQNRLRNFGIAQLNSFFRQSDAEPIDAFLLQTARALDSAMAIGVGFYG